MKNIEGMLSTKIGRTKIGLTKRTTKPGVAHISNSHRCYTQRKDRARHAEDFCMLAQSEANYLHPSMNAVESVLW